MIIAVSSQGPGLASSIDPRFGRAAGFVVIDTDTDEHSYFDNEQNLQLAQGAGIQAAQNVAKTGAQAILTGHVGPKAFLALDKGKIQIFLGASGTVAEALEAYKNGTMQPASAPDKQGHW
ncbi:NifB/NifX family molybdenum-iron cluster-binding protein [Desulfovibrio ferrophilus]|uniref:Dinitrogenase iron-molybdenum cofactor biosynthesis protein n=1 Tax=Desulfovibrio ferrophilus TaxID=241368 RepID=A0A2Z6AW02_9BACT|nr:NifB/NifX family molybdenum-iron cluster-binding protein [Desulfovibrio ferrophilus]BBD07422.1 dinitrogenase iron-molybdenum cofactor biosynthesis protein [Desulfovibrio ferrophilus]